MDMNKTDKQNEANKQVEDTATATEEKNQPIEIIGVTFRSASKIYYFAPNGITAQLGDFVIVETSRGLEFGKVLVPNKFLPISEVVMPLKSIIRKATEDDKQKHEKNRLAEEDARKICEERIKALNYEMNLVDVEYTFDNSKLLFYFTADGRVDFRELVKNLASIFKTRIELRQIGIRDEAKIMGGLGSCGRPFCCSEFLSEFAQVSIKMAKEQNFSLNSAKISGSCGRLMCCLRYEHETYEEALKTTPRIGSTVSTSAGNGTIIETRPLLQLVKVRLDDKPETPKLFECSEVKVIKGAKANNSTHNDEEIEEIKE